MGTQDHAAAPGVLVVSHEIIKLFFVLNIKAVLYL
jgi:hypothetical protein